MKVTKLLFLFLMACGGSGGSGGGDYLTGADGNDLSRFWLSIDVPGSENGKMLNFAQLRSEVMRTTGQSWTVAGEDQWEKHRIVLGAGNEELGGGFDSQPSQQKITTIRRMAFQVCETVVAAEAGQGTREVFDQVDPASDIDPAGTMAADQIRSLHDRFVLEENISQGDLNAATSLLADLKAMGSMEQGWQGVCAGYLASMAFLTY